MDLTCQDVCFTSYYRALIDVAHTHTHSQTHTHACPLTQSHPQARTHFLSLCFSLTAHNTHAHMHASSFTHDSCIFIILLHKISLKPRVFV